MFDQSNYNTFDSNKLSIAISSDNLFYVNRYKIYYDAKEFRIRAPENSNIIEFTDKYNQKQIKLTCHENTFNKFIRKVEHAINNILQRRFNSSIKLIYKNDMYIHVTNPESKLSNTIEFSIPYVSINKQKNSADAESSHRLVSCRLILL